MNSNTTKNSTDRSAFPNSLAPDDVKLTNEYGLQWAKAIESEWFRQSGTTTGEYYQKRQLYNTLRLYARGEQETTIYEKMLGIDKDGTKSFTNYDLRPIQVIPKFVKLITNQMSERLFEIKAQAVDSYSLDLREDKRNEMIRLMASKQLFINAKKYLGIDLMPAEGEEQIPDSREEIDLRMKLKYKPNVEIAAEESIKFTMQLNDYKEIQSNILNDLTVLGIAAVSHKTDPSKGIIVEYEDPANLVYAYPTSRNFKDVYYYGCVKKMSVLELKRISGNTFTDDEIKEMSNNNSKYPNFASYSNDNFYRNSDFEGSLVEVMHFTFKALNTLSYKKKYSANGGFKMTKKDGSFSKTSKENTGYDAVKKNIEVWYEGYFVIGTDKIFNYKLCENMIRPDSDFQKVYPPYILFSPDLYQNRSRSLVATIIPYVDQMQQVHIKLQQFIAKSKPQGIHIDISGLEEIDLGDGNGMTAMDLIKFYNETGNTIGRSVNSEGEFNYGKNPITENRNGFYSGMSELMGTYTHYLNLVRDAIGIPIGVDASTPNPDMAVGVQQQLAVNSNTATRHILDGTLNITERLCEAISLRLKDIFKYPNLKSGYERALGTVNVNLLKSLNDYSLRDFSIFIELKPDAVEKQYLEAAIQIALGSGGITLDDAIDIRSIGNIKLANEVLKRKLYNRGLEKKKEAQEMIQMNAQANMQASDMAAKSKLEELKKQSKKDLELVQAKTKGSLLEIEGKKNADLALMNRQFELNMRLKGIEVNEKLESENAKEQAKLDRLNINNTQASALIAQRQTKGSPLNFESSEDSITGGIDLPDASF